MIQIISQPKKERCHRINEIKFMTSDLEVYLTYKLLYQLSPQN
ncbi:hypothetical protein GXM_04434 [Nostoc sphaeroides CCNUC1]|uniref:Uncharacterized protein n=1 Tax=Nostoc sphaeroides CCNUC1 TaxID=2653204 RepID=A0A5P8W2N1_9NOSO|nr:hypothetical protein GXM_04434 [Nostoc sphaeroides CCNUC1]